MQGHRVSNFAESAAEQLRCQALPSATKRPQSPKVYDSFTAGMREEEDTAWAMAGPPPGLTEGRVAADGSIRPSWPAAATCAGPACMANWDSTQSPDDLWPAAPATYDTGADIDTTLIQREGVVSLARDVPPSQQLQAPVPASIPPASGTLLASTEQQEVVGGAYGTADGEYGCNLAAAQTQPAASARQQLPVSSAGSCLPSTVGGTDRSRAPSTAAAVHALPRHAAKKRLQLSPTPPRAVHSEPMMVQPGAAASPEVGQSAGGTWVDNLPQATAATAVPRAKKARLAVSAGPRRSAPVTVLPVFDTPAAPLSTAPGLTGPLSGTIAMSSGTGLGNVTSPSTLLVTDRRSSRRLAAAPKVVYTSPGGDSGGGEDHAIQLDDAGACEPGLGLGGGSSRQAGKGQGRRQQASTAGDIRPAQGPSSSAAGAGAGAGADSDDSQPAGDASSSSGDSDEEEGRARMVRPKAASTARRRAVTKEGGVVKRAPRKRKAAAPADGDGAGQAAADGTPAVRKARCVPLPGLLPLYQPLLPGLPPLQVLSLGHSH